MYNNAHHATVLNIYGAHRFTFHMPVSPFYIFFIKLRRSYIFRKTVKKIYLRNELPSKMIIFGVIGIPNFIPNVKELVPIFIVPKTKVNNTHFVRLEENTLMDQ